jgi:PAS domain S-box-containing protein
MSMNITTLPNGVAFAERAASLALRIAEADSELQAHASGQVDAFVDSRGEIHLLQPAQMEMQACLKRLQALIDSGSDLTMVISRGGVIEFASQAARPMLGFGPSDIKDRNFFDLVHPEDLHEGYSVFFNVIEEFRKDARIEYRLRARDGSFRRLEASVNKLRDPSASSVVWTSRDADRRPPPSAEVTAARDRLLGMLVRDLDLSLAPLRRGASALTGGETLEELRALAGLVRSHLDQHAAFIDEVRNFVGACGCHAVSPASGPNGRACRRAADAAPRTDADRAVRRATPTLDPQHSTSTDPETHKPKN